MACADCRAAPKRICAFHARTDNLHSDEDLEIDRLTDEVRQLRAQRDQVVLILRTWRAGDDSPEGEMGPRWVLGQIELALGIER